MSNVTTTFHQIKRIEFEYHPDKSEPEFSFLQLRIYSKDHEYVSHKLAFFASDHASADHLHNIFLSVHLLMDPIQIGADKPPQSEKEPSSC